MKRKSGKRPSHRQLDENERIRIGMGVIALATVVFMVILGLVFAFGGYDHRPTKTVDDGRTYIRAASKTK